MGKKKGKKESALVPVASEGESFAQWSASDPAFASWWFGTHPGMEPVTPYTVLGLSAALRSVNIISGTIASLPLRTYQRTGEERTRVESVFDDPYEGVDGMTAFEWVETIIIHELLWRNAYLWHEDVDGEGRPSRYRPLVPDLITKVERSGGRKLFTFNESTPDGKTERTVDSDWITHIPGPSVDGVIGLPMLHACRAIFSGAIGGDKTAGTTLAGGIRIGALAVPAENEEFTPEEGQIILDQLRAKTMGSDNAGDIALVNRRIELRPWTPTHIESQWHEAKGDVVADIGRIFGVPPHLLGDTEKQTSWGTGVAEQNRGFAQYTLKGWSDRIERRLSQRLPKGQFVEFDYKGLLQGTPGQEIPLLIAQKEAGVLDVDEVRKVLNLPPLTPKQKAAMAPPTPLPAPTALPQEVSA